MPAFAQSVPVRDPVFVFTTGAAAYLGLSPRTLEKWRVLGDGPPYSRLGGRRVVYYLADLDAWLMSRRAGGASA